MRTLPGPPADTHQMPEEKARDRPVWEDTSYPLSTHTEYLWRFCKEQREEENWMAGERVRNLVSNVK